MSVVCIKKDIGTNKNGVEAKFDPQPSQGGEKDKKEEKKYVPWAGFELTTLRLRVLHLTARLKLQSVITLVKFDRPYSKVNQVIYSSSPIS